MPKPAIDITTASQEQLEAKLSEFGLSGLATFHKCSAWLPLDGGSCIHCVRGLVVWIVTIF